MAKISIILFSGSIDKLLPVGILSSAAAAIGMDVEIYATFWGLMALKKGFTDNNMDIDKESDEMRRKLFNILREKNVPSWIDMIKKAKEIGNVKVYACAMTFDMFGMDREELIDIVDGVVGAGEYLEKAKEADITLFI